MSKEAFKMAERNRRPKAIVLTSGGLDSGVCLAEAVQKFDVAILHVNYGQLTEARELQAFHQLGDHYQIENRLVTDISYLKDIGGSSLVDETMTVEMGMPAVAAATGLVSASIRATRSSVDKT